MCTFVHLKDWILEGGVGVNQLIGMLSGTNGNNKYTNDWEGKANQSSGDFLSI